MAAIPGYRYRMYDVDGDEVGVYETLAWNWEAGDTVELPSGGGRYWILSIVGIDESDDSNGKYQAAWMVEPAE
jgi:hypothetical protein